MRSNEVDGNAWITNPKHNFVYNKLWLCKTQGIKAAPAAVKPDKYPVFYKPIINLYSLGAYSFKAEKPLNRDIHAGLFWMPYLQGRHWTFDCYFSGSVENIYALEAEKENDNFKLWKPLENFDLDFVYVWLNKHLGDYVGNLNVEGIGDKIIEVHLRNSEQIVEMRNKNKPYSAPIFGKYKKYQIESNRVESFFEKNYPTVECVLTLKNGFPEIGMGDHRRLAYLLGESESQILDAVKKFQKTFL